jgi:hypothetical protein
VKEIIVMKHVFSFAASVVFLVGSAAGAEESLSTDELTFFETKIRPVLVRECYGCHSSKAGNVRGGLLSAFSPSNTDTFPNMIIARILTLQKHFILLPHD